MRAAPQAFQPLDDGGGDAAVGGVVERVVPAVGDQDEVGGEASGEPPRGGGRRHRVGGPVHHQDRHPGDRYVGDRYVVGGRLLGRPGEVGGDVLGERAGPEVRVGGQQAPVRRAGRPGAELVRPVVGGVRGAGRGDRGGQADEQQPVWGGPPGGGQREQGAGVRAGQDHGGAWRGAPAGLGDRTGQVHPVQRGGACGGYRRDDHAVAVEGQPPAEAGVHTRVLAPAGQ